MIKKTIKFCAIGALILCITDSVAMRSNRRGSTSRIVRGGAQNPNGGYRGNNLGLTPSELAALDFDIAFQMARDERSRPEAAPVLSQLERDTAQALELSIGEQNERENIARALASIARSLGIGSSERAQELLLPDEAYAESLAAESLIEQEIADRLFAASLMTDEDADVSNASSTTSNRSANPDVPSVQEESSETQSQVSEVTNEPQACGICFAEGTTDFSPCCAKVICQECWESSLESDQPVYTGNRLVHQRRCPFCRSTEQERSTASNAVLNEQ